MRDVVWEAALAVDLLFDSRDFQVASKGEQGPVTSADLVANYICHKGLTALLPEAGWLSEESVDDTDRLERDFVWIVDPIDGTREFVKGTPEFSVSVGLAYRGEPVLGAVALPADRRILYGARGQGVRDARHGRAPADFFAPRFRELLKEITPQAIDEYLGENPEIRDRAVVPEFQEYVPEISRRGELPGSKILISATEERKGKFDGMRSDFGLSASGSIARKLSLLAGGEGDLNVSLFPKNEWDICGGTALVLAWPDTAVIELERGETVPFNRPFPISYGLAAGSRDLVERFFEYFRAGDFSLARDYS